MVFRSFIDIEVLGKDELLRILEIAVDVKVRPEAYSSMLSGKSVALLFEKHSTRTRVSFEVAVYQLGGNAVVLHARDMQLSRGESVYDTAAVLSRYVDALVIRCYEHEFLCAFAEYSGIPVINALTDYSHPCQIMADLMTYSERKAPINDQTRFAWVGDFNNVLMSWIHAACKIGFPLCISVPSERFPGESGALSKYFESGFISWVEDPFDGVNGVDAVVTDSWRSMGSDLSSDEIYKMFSKYQVNMELFSQARDDAVFLHCLPAHRGEEVTDDVISSPRSLVFDEAENRLYVQKAILVWCMGIM